MRDGFTMPADDYALIAQLQATDLESGLAVSKSAVLRAGLHALRGYPETKLGKKVTLFNSSRRSPQERSAHTWYRKSSRGDPIPRM